MKYIDINDGWAFTYGDYDWTKPSNPARVNLPHDFIISLPRDARAAGGGSNGYFGEGRGEYTRRFAAAPEWAGQKVILEVDGAYMNAEVIFNGQHLFTHPYGYTPFQVDLTGEMRFEGENQLTIITQSRQPSTRWYSGGGLYRGARLLVGPEDGLNPWQVFITARVSGGAAQLDVRVDGPVKTSVIDAQGSVVAQGAHSVAIENVRLWDVDDPYLYTVRLERPDGRDRADIPFGVRTIEIDAQSGFRLNGRPMKLRGGCVHHDNGCLGAAAHPAAERRKIESLKALGYNAVRSSHYPPSSALLEACDRAGMLVLDETFDVWLRGKKPLDYHLYFRDWWARDIESMVRRDRNHPCVFAYSIGNEIEERDGSSQGVMWAWRQREKVLSLDPTRPITSALNNIFVDDAPLTKNLFDRTENPIEAQDFVNDPFGRRTEAFAAALDIAGYNYLLPRYAYDRAKYPARVIMGTETFASNTYDYWRATLENPNVIGDFIWTAVDYLGEAGIGRTMWEDDPKSLSGGYPWALSYDADLDITLERRPQSYFREIMWGRASGPVLMTLHPDRHGVRCGGMGWQWMDVHPSWTYPDAWLEKPVDVYAYADADEVEFILNGQSMGRAAVEKLCAHMALPYRPGRLEAVALRGGEMLGCCALETTGAACKIALELERAPGPGDEGMAFVRIQLLDEAGRRAVADDRGVEIRAEGGELLALGNADPFSAEPYAGARRMTYRGSALCVARVADGARLTLSATAEGLAPARLEIAGA